MKKFTVCLLIGAMAASMLTGCGSNGGSSDSSDSKADSSSETMTIMMNGSDSDAFMEGYRKIVDGFNESNEYGVMHNVMHRLEQKRFEQKLLSQKDEFGEKHDAVSQVNSLFVQSSNTIKSILTDIAQNYEQNISLSDLAEKYHFSESYISRKIKKETGYTFVDILNGIRLMCAASLIKTGEKISDVCEKTGFNDQHYFSQLFKKTFGCTPSNYRNENGENFPGLYEILNSKSGNGK